YVRDDAVVAAAKLSARYLSGRQLPDKAVDVLDTACARVKLSLSSKPAEIDSRERRLAELQRAHDALDRDRASDVEADPDEMSRIEAEIDRHMGELDGLNARWEKERALATEMVELRKKLGIGAFETGTEQAADAELLAQLDD